MVLRFEGSGYAKQRATPHAAGKESSDFSLLGYGLALVVLAAKMGVDAGESRRAAVVELSLAVPVTIEISKSAQRRRRRRGGASS